jgi:hypothetical protein
VSPVRYELDVYIPEDDILHSHSSENLKFYIIGISFRDLPACSIVTVLLGGSYACNLKVAQSAKQVAISAVPRL